MKGFETKFVAYMQGHSKRFVIPVYQRNYDWKTENCKQLFDDLVKVVRKKRKSHFFGSIVSVFNPDGPNDEYLVIDGQQRLTTVSLLLLSIYNLIENKAITPESTNLSQRIYEEYLVDKWQDRDTRIKLKPIKNDRQAFGKLFDDESDYIKESNLTINYKYFFERIQKEEISVDELYDAICRLEIINITLNNDDNPQLIFESLNSTGVALSEGDKIRNFIIMGLSTKKQNEYYEKYWNKIEVCTDYDVSSFIRDYLSVKLQTTPSFNKIYFTFKAYVEDGGVETDDLLKELLFYARQYQILLKGTSADKRLNACIYRLNRLETTVTRPFFLEVLRLWQDEKLNLDELADVFHITENYLFRRTICDLPTNAMNKVFLLLHKEILRFDGTDDNYVEKLKYALLSKKDRVRFPDDAEFIDAFETRHIYQMNSKNKIYILEKLENFGTIEDKDIYRHFDDGEYSIEHIMPQHLTPAWVNDLGSDYEEIHEIWLHRIANLTLTAYNSSYSNNSFPDKKTIKNGFAHSGIRMNQYIAKNEIWGLHELEDRNNHLMKRALEIWQVPGTKYKPENTQLDSYTLDDDVNLTGRLIARFSYKTIEQPVNSWIDMYERLLKIIHSEDKSVLSRLAYIKDDSIDLSTHISDDKTTLRSYGEIDDGLYVEKKISTWGKISVLRRLFKLYNTDPDDLIFYLRGENESKEEGIIVSRQEIRMHYWTYALNHINKAHEVDGCFKNVNPTKRNWINGYIGISGFKVCCVAKFDGARVEMLLEKANKEENKTAYDQLFKHKAEIEKALNNSVEWSRGDDIKSSKVFCKIDNVSINNETDWVQMAKFHAEWSKKFYDVFVPLLNEL